MKPGFLIHIALTLAILPATLGWFIALRIVLHVGAGDDFTELAVFTALLASGFVGLIGAGLVLIALFRHQSGGKSARLACTIGVIAAVFAGSFFLGLADTSRGAELAAIFLFLVPAIAGAFVVYRSRPSAFQMPSPDVGDGN